MKTSEKIFWDLYKANSQQEVSDVINKYSELKDQKTGYLMVVTKVILEHSSQQNHPVPALIERLHSTDAILIKDCRLHGIDPKSKEKVWTKQLKNSINKRWSDW
jgi:hypothetical protein